MPENDVPPQEKSAKETIDNLRAGKLATSTIKEVKSAADRALSDRAIGGIGRS